MFPTVFLRGNEWVLPRKRRKGAFVSESALHILMAISRILSGQFLSQDDHLSLPTRNRGTRARSRGRGTVMRRYPRIFIGPAALPLFCLAPHGVFRASRITPRAVSSYLAFSPLPALCCQRTGGVFSVTLSVNVRFRERCPRILRGMPPYGVRTFLQRILRFTSDHLPSEGNLSQPARKKREPRIACMKRLQIKTGRAQ